MFALCKYDSRCENYGPDRSLEDLLCPFTLTPELPQTELNEVACQLNERPTKTLDYETPADRFNACVALTGWIHSQKRTFTNQKYKSNIRACTGTSIPGTVSLIQPNRQAFFWNRFYIYQAKTKPTNQINSLRDSSLFKRTKSRPEESKPLSQQIQLYAHDSTRSKRAHKLTNKGLLLH